MINPNPMSESRLDSAKSTVEVVNLLKDADFKRREARARVKGLIDGNLPFSPAELRRTGQAFRSNFNTREGESYLAQGTGAFYDILTEAPTYCTVTTEAGGPEKAQEWSDIITEEFDRLQKEDCEFDYTMQLSQYEMVLVGIGPVFWPDKYDWRCQPLKNAECLVPDGTRSNVESWEICAVPLSYTVSRLYSYIRNEEVAKSAGWNVGAVKKSIMNAATEPNDKRGNWEYHQQQLRNNDIYHSARSKKINIVHVYLKDVSGKITHLVVDEQNTEAFLLERRDEYECWKEVICPMYYDKGDGQHHSVKGMGVKMFPILETKNRLKNSLVDSALIRSNILLKPKSADAAQTAQIAHKGGFSLLPPNHDVEQQANAGMALDAPLAVDRDLDNILAGNLSQYRNRIEKPSGNPRTAFEVEAIMAQQSTLSKTQLNRYYQQLDDMYTERFRRATNPDIPKATEYGEEALEFQRRCMKRGVKREAFEECIVKATRVAGQGSQFMRAQILSEMLGTIAGSIPESGRTFLIRDYIASRAGQSMVKRYMPETVVSTKDQDQMYFAGMEHGAIKDAVTPLITGTQNHLIHIQVHLQNGAEAYKAVEQSPDSVSSVASYLSVLVPHIGEHLQHLSADAVRAPLVKPLAEQFNQLQNIAQQMVQRAQEYEKAKADEEAAKQQASADAVNKADEKIRMQESQAESARKDRKLESDLELKRQKAEQNMAIKDAEAASSIAMKRKTSEHAMKLKEKQAREQKKSD